MSNEMYTELGEHALDGFARQRRSARVEQVASAVALWNDLRNGRVPSYFLQEALFPQTPGVARIIESNYPGLFREGMTRSDFPLLTGDVIDRMALARYNTFPSPWKQFATTKTLRDFRTVRRIAMNGLEGQWSDVPETDEFQYGSASETGYTYTPKKYVKGAKISFETIMNDDLDQFTSIPDRLGRGGARTVNKFVTGLYVDANGPHASLYTVGNANKVTSNAVLSVTALGTAWSILRQMTDTDGEPIMVESAVLVVPPALEVTARNILNSVQIWATTQGGATGQEVHYNNWIGGSLQLAVDPYIPVVASSANGNTSWFVFANPQISRPAIEVGFLAGFQEPQLYQKVSDTMRVGGGGVDQAVGSWGSMAQEYKGIIAFGGTRLDAKCTVSSNGSGS